MANMTFANLKIYCLRRAGNHYNANDSTLLEIAGAAINDALSVISTFIKNTAYLYDLENTVNTTTNQAYVDLTDTDIVDILQVYQRVSDTKLKRISRAEYAALVPDTTRGAGIPEYAFCPTQALNGSGQNIWSLYLYPIPSSVVAIYYDYIKNLRFSADGTGADAEFSPLPTIYNKWIADEFRPIFFGIVDPANVNKIRMAEQLAKETRAMFSTDIRVGADEVMQPASYASRSVITRRVETTPAP